MKPYPISEIFYSIQGEGYWAGMPVIFIRLSGCNLKCPFCDTDHTTKSKLTPKQIATKIYPIRCDRVVITGGEPTIHDLQPLVDILKEHDYLVHLETNGTYPERIPWDVDWVAFSPKRLLTPVPNGTKEIKLLCGMDEWATIAYDYLEPIPKVKWIGMQPIAPKWEKPCLKFCMEHPHLRYSMQLHKKLGVR